MDTWPLGSATALHTTLVLSVSQATELTPRGRAAAARLRRSRRFCGFQSQEGVHDAYVPSAWRAGSLKGALMMLGDGDLVVMGGACQSTHKHEVMPARSKELSEQHGRRVGWLAVA